MIPLNEKISFLSGFSLTLVVKLASAAATISFIGIIQASLVGLAGGFFGILGKEIFYALKDKMRSAKFKVWLIGKLDKLAAKIGVLKRWW